MFMSRLQNSLRNNLVGRHETMQLGFIFSMLVLLGQNIGGKILILVLAIIFWI